MDIQKKIAVIGAGTMGIGIAKYFLIKGCEVTLIDENKIVLESVGQLFSRSHSLKELDRLMLTSNMDELQNISLVIEAIPEVKEWKKDLYIKLESKVSPQTVIATNTSGIPINELCDGLVLKERFLGMHFYTPADIIPIVEVIKGKETSEMVLKDVLGWLKEMDKIPVLVKKDVPGFIGNRLQHAMAREAISLIENDIADAEDIDLVAKYALGVRLVVSGPLEQRDLNGLDVHYNIAGYLYEQLENRRVPSDILKNKVSKNELGLKTGIGFYKWKEDPQKIREEVNKELNLILGVLKKNDLLNNRFESYKIDD